MRRGEPEGKSAIQIMKQNNRRNVGERVGWSGGGGGGSTPEKKTKCQGGRYATHTRSVKLLLRMDVKKSFSILYNSHKRDNLT